MRAPRFWYPGDSAEASAHLPSLLYPLSLVFRLGTFLRRLVARPYRAKIPLICIGNVVAGGAGKTPTALALAQILKRGGHRPVFVTRGYGGIETSKRAVIHINIAKHNALDVGDEALLLARTAPTWAGRDRVKAIREAEKQGSIIIMDDGLQNPGVCPSKSLLVIDSDVGLGNGFILPAGPLRETLTSVLKRVAGVILIGERDTQKLASKIKQPVFRARLRPDLPFGFQEQGKFVAFAGIARPGKFYATAQALGLDVVDALDFPDHHMFSQDDIDNLQLRAEEKGARLLTTEKDFVRLPAGFRDEVIELPVILVFDERDAESKIERICGS